MQSLFYGPAPDTSFSALAVGTPVGLHITILPIAFGPAPDFYASVPFGQASPPTPVDPAAIEIPAVTLITSCISSRW